MNAAYIISIVWQVSHVRYTQVVTLALGVVA